jgi:hypothetical protein
MEEQGNNNSSSQKYESIHALIRNLHDVGSARNITRRQSHDASSLKGLERSTSDRSVNSVHTLPILQVDKLARKRSVFDFKIPLLTISGALLHTPETPDESHRRFSFGHFRRHSHTPVRTLIIKLLN